VNEVERTFMRVTLIGLAGRAASVAAFLFT
jgi:hypothetical protein